MKPKMQHHPQRRAPHGAPELTERFQIRLSPALKARVMDQGGAEWIRKLIEKEAKSA
jgi:hypothetical protein